MKKTIFITAILSAFLMISCQSPANDSDVSDFNNNNPENTKGDPNNSNNNPDKNKQNNPDGDSGNKNTNNQEVVLDLSNTRQFSMKVGETVKLAATIGDYEVYYEVESGDSVEVTGAGLKANTVGVSTLKAIDWNNQSRSWYCTVSVTVEGFSGSAVEYKLCGSWNRDSNDGSKLVLNKDKTGTMKNYLNGQLLQDWTFTWNCSEGNGKKFLNITGCNDNQTNTSVSDKSFTIESVSSTSVSLTGNLGFGMPRTTNWNKE